jgi:hypothetical protein
VAESVTAVPVGTEMDVPDLVFPRLHWHRPPPAEREVVTVTGVVTDVTVSTSDPQVVVEAALVESPE